MAPNYTSLINNLQNAQVNIRQITITKFSRVTTTSPTTRTTTATIRPTTTKITKSSTTPSTKLNSCKPKRFVLARLHKVGSTTLVSLLKRLANRYKFISNQPTFDCWSFGYPGPFNKTLVNIHHLPKSDILYNHMRWDIGRRKIDKILRYPSRNRTKSITIMRNPIDQFFSTYHYYYQRSYYTRSEIEYLPSISKDVKLSCRHAFPYAALTIPKNDTETTLYNFQPQRPMDELITNLKFRGLKYLKQQPWWFRMVNFQSFDLSNISPEKLASEFDFIFINERWDESLLLLKEELCLDFSDICSFIHDHRENTFGEYDIRTHPDFMLSTENKKYVEKNLINLDNLLYAQALEMFEKKLDDYGRQRMQEDLIVLRNQTCFQTEYPEIWPKIYPVSFTSKVENYMNQYSGLCHPAWYQDFFP